MLEAAWVLARYRRAARSRRRAARAGCRRARCSPRPARSRRPRRRPPSRRGCVARAGAGRESRPAPACSASAGQQSRALQAQSEHAKLVVQTSWESRRAVLAAALRPDPGGARSGRARAARARRVHRPADRAEQPPGLRRLAVRRRHRRVAVRAAAGGRRRLQGRQRHLRARRSATRCCGRWPPCCASARRPATSRCGSAATSSPSWCRGSAHPAALRASAPSASPSGSQGYPWSTIADGVQVRVSTRLRASAGRTTRPSRARLAGSATYRRADQDLYAGKGGGGRAGWPQLTAPAARRPTCTTAEYQRALSLRVRSWVS